MPEIVSKLKFKGLWRSYQQRVLDELSYHLNDNKLNVVAAPGAGKTTLGIEVMLRLKNSALILAPTITIKNQWKQRIIDNFLPDNISTDNISTDINNITEITISTYQGLHSLYKDKNNRENFINELKKKNIDTIILDEAHHLRTEWWATLNDLYKNLYNEKLKIVSLTGTPPYDVSPNEWNNYNSLCGPVDAEISIPELVKAKDLCPHQDLIYFSNLTEEEQNIIFDFDKSRNEFFSYLEKSSDFLYIIESSVFLNNIETNVDIIYQNTTFTISLISYLLKEDSLSTNARILTEFLGLTIEQIPTFDYEIAETLFNGIIGEFNSYFQNTIIIKNKLRELKLINGKKVTFTGQNDLKKLFARSKNKLNAIYSITDFEYKNQKNDLREVVLLDYIGKGDSEGLNIISVFEKICPIGAKIGILTGTLVVIPKNSKQELYKILDEKHIDKLKVLTTEFNKDYLRVETYGNIDIVSIITRMFESGFMNVLVGTAALLGEGWDSPCVNTLIIASVVGSFMLSNQMRGRALRIDKNKPDKTANIWHLVSLAEESPDLATVEKRFNTFEGISYNENKIQNGIVRLALNNHEIKSLNCEKLNHKMLEYAKDRYDLKNKWQQVFSKSCITEKFMAPQVYDVMLGDNTQNPVVCVHIPKWCGYVNTLVKDFTTFKKYRKQNFFQRNFLKFLNYIHWIGDDYEDIITQNYRIYDKERKLQLLAEALLHTLCNLSIIKTNIDNIKLKVNVEFNSNFYITVVGCTNYERSIFIKSYNEIFDIKDTNRYILRQGDKYIAVPECIATHSKNVKMFVKYLEFEFFDIIYTRNPNGYKELLKAKYNKQEYGRMKHSRVWI